MPPAEEIRGMSVVLLGDFNPRIFQPAWFGGRGLIRPTEADEADVEIVHSEVTKFRLDWVVLQVTRDRFVVETSQDAFFEASRDLVLATFSLLGHTPLRAMGINMEAHWRMASVDAWRRFSRVLVPEGTWQGLLDQAGLQNLTMRGARPDHYRGHVQIQVQPSRRIADGVFLSVNDHYVAARQSVTQAAGAHAAMEILRENWEASRERSLSILERLVKNGEI